MLRLSKRTTNTVAHCPSSLAGQQWHRRMRCSRHQLYNERHGYEIATVLPWKAWPADQMPL